MRVKDNTKFASKKLIVFFCQRPVNQFTFYYTKLYVTNCLFVLNLLFIVGGLVMMSLSVYVVSMSTT